MLLQVVPVVLPVEMPLEVEPVRVTEGPVVLLVVALLPVDVLMAAVVVLPVVVPTSGLEGRSKASTRPLISHTHDQTSLHIASYLSRRAHLYHIPHSSQNAHFTNSCNTPLSIEVLECKPSTASAQLHSTRMCSRPVKLRSAVHVHQSLAMWTFNIASASINNKACPLKRSKLALGLVLVNGKGQHQRGLPRDRQNVTPPLAVLAPDCAVRFEEVLVVWMAPQLGVASCWPLIMNLPVESVAVREMMAVLGRGRLNSMVRWSVGYQWDLCLPGTSWVAR